MKRTFQYIVNPYRRSGYEAFFIIRGTTLLRFATAAHFSALPLHHITQLHSVLALPYATLQYLALAPPQYKSEREARPFTIHYSLFTFHCLEPRSKQTCLRCRCISVHSHAHALHTLRYRAIAIHFHALPLIVISIVTSFL